MPPSSNERPQPARRSGAARAAASFVLWAAFFAVAAPLIAWFAHPVLPRNVSNLLFFFPQRMFPFLGAVHRGPHGSVRAFSPPSGWALSAALWIPVAVAFVVVARRWKLGRSTWILAPVLIVLITTAVNLVLGMAGVPVELDGP